MCAHKTVCQAVPSLWLIGTALFLCGGTTSVDPARKHSLRYVGSPRTGARYNEEVELVAGPARVQHFEGRGLAA